MIPDSSDSRPSVRPLATASGRVACSLLLAGLLLTACTGESRSGTTGPIIGGGSSGGDSARAVPAFAQVTAGDAHTCALTENNVAWCWGANADGQLGRGRVTATGRADTVRSGTLRQVSAGGGHTCALDPNGVAWCWGRNAEGQLGIGAVSTRSLVPVRVTGSRSWLFISAGTTHTCGIAQNGTAFCWGSNSDGQLGTGVAGTQTAPVQVAGLADVVAISAGDRFTCVLRPTGTAACWGRAGRLGSLGASATPRTVDGTAAYAGLDVGGRAACALEPALQRAACWGEAGAVGSGATGASPARVTLDVDLASVSVGGTSACALTTTGLARCWGSNATGQLGLGTTVTDTGSTTPRPVAGDPLFASVSVGGAHACAINQRLETFCWGSNASGQLGTVAVAAPVRTPTRVP
jgi:alpha-tubulin suppressor-like RCC1 family protein